jgi:hypothetical protein
MKISITRNYTKTIEIDVDKSEEDDYFWDNMEILIKEENAKEIEDKFNKCELNLVEEIFDSQNNQYTI